MNFPAIDATAFTPASALAGGLLIGLAASALALLNGRIAGISGIFAGVLARQRAGDFAWRAAFVLGLLIAPAAWRMLATGIALPAPRIAAGYGMLVAAGMIVGYGTRLGSGCTSGHGVCGLSRLSPRSLAATLVFMALGFATVALLRHGLAGSLR